MKSAANGVAELFPPSPVQISPGVLTAAENSAAAYNPSGAANGPQPAAGWTQINNPADRHYNNAKIGFSASLYENKATGKYMLAFRGTVFTNLPDWQNNLEQGAYMDSAQYDAAVRLARKLQRRYGNNLSVAGHSLGGGLAAAAAGATGLHADTFNAAGLSVRTRLSIPNFNSSGVTNYSIEGYIGGDPLTRISTQDFEPAAGRQVFVPANLPWYDVNPIHYHSIGTVISSLRKQMGQ